MLGAVLAMSGCASAPSRPLWGENATYRPGWSRIRDSAIAAARDPWVWGPLVAAGVLQVDNADHRISDWARDHTPVFGSQDNAAQWSDDLRSASTLAYLGTALLAPSGDGLGTWIENKAKGGLVGVGAAALTSITTRELKKATGRERPDGSDTESFPSGHVSRSAVFTQLASRNLQYFDISRGTRTALDVGLDSLTIATAWARIEAGAHFPSDTLFGMALGNFFGAFVNDAFLGSPEAAPASVAFTALPGGAALQFEVRF
jgi:hypothetical protein